MENGYRRKPILGATAPEEAERPFDADAAAKLYPPIGRFVALPDGRKVHYWERGDGPPLILIHGASGNLRDWTFSIAPELARDFRVIAFDRPGFGYTDRDPENGGDPAVQARTLQHAARLLGVERPIVAGHSMGAVVALAWGIRYPGETRGVIPISSPAMPFRGYVRLFRTLGLDGMIIDGYINRFKNEAINGGGIDRFIARIFRPLKPPPGYLDYVGAPLALRDETLQANGEDFQAVTPALERMEKEYPDLKAPVEIIHGGQDFLCAAYHAVPLSRLAPLARLTLLGGVGHMAHHANVEAIRDAARRLAA